MRAAAKWKQGQRRAAREAAIRRHRCRHQHAGLSDVIKFLTVAAPTRLGTASARHLPFANPARKSRYVDFPISGFGGGVGHPLTVRRNLARAIRTTSLNK